MPIETKNLKLLESERIRTDAEDGGGKYSGREIVDGLTQNGAGEHNKKFVMNFLGNIQRKQRKILTQNLPHQNVKGVASIDG